MEHAELFWNADIGELKQGYTKQGEHYICLLCGRTHEQGIIYPYGDTLLDAERYTRQHIADEHGSVFEYLIGLDKKLTGLTEHQNRLLGLFHDGKSDAEVQQEMGIGSASTIRNHRFALKEKERQAKVFLTMMELLKEKDQHAPRMVSIPPKSGMIDDRYNITEEERTKVLDKYFPDGMSGRLKKFTMQEKHKLIVLREIIGRFTQGQRYTEKEVNAILKDIYDDYVTVRRYLIEYGFMQREADGSQYWLTE